MKATMPLMFTLVAFSFVPNAVTPTVVRPVYLCPATDGYVIVDPTIAWVVTP
jgi:hypothetical protein